MLTQVHGSNLQTNLLNYNNRKLTTMSLRKEYIKINKVNYQQQDIEHQKNSIIRKFQLNFNLKIMSFI